MKETLKSIIANPLIEARWLNTVSLLELMGARKIAKTVCKSHPQIEVLEHFADESRHAYAFKKLAMTVDPQVSEYLCQEEGITYFQSLDYGIKKMISELLGGDDQFLNYLLTTTLIERRAMKLYPLYRELAQHPAVIAELDRVIAEESNHRVPLEIVARERLKSFGETVWNQMQAFEDELFETFAQHLQKAV